MMARYFLYVLFSIFFCFPSANAGTYTYQEPAAFLADSFGNDVPKPRALWITKSLRPEIRRILGHDLNRLRLRYWETDGRTAWILNEIGKEKPITIGVTVREGRIERLRILIFRESRGGQVRRPFFTDQFDGVTLGSNQRLDRDIDGISGATLSVRAVVRIARLALYLHGKREIKP